MDTLWKVVDAAILIADRKSTGRNNVNSTEVGTTRNALYGNMEIENP